MSVHKFNLGVLAYTSWGNLRPATIGAGVQRQGGGHRLVSRHQGPATVARTRSWQGYRRQQAEAVQRGDRDVRCRRRWRQQHAMGGGARGRREQGAEQEARWRCGEDEQDVEKGRAQANHGGRRCHGRAGQASSRQEALGCGAELGGGAGARRWGDIGRQERWIGRRGPATR